MFFFFSVIILMASEYTRKERFCWNI